MNKPRYLIEFPEPTELARQMDEWMRQHVAETVKKLEAAIPAEWLPFIEAGTHQVWWDQQETCEVHDAILVTYTPRLERIVYFAED